MAREVFGKNIKTNLETIVVRKQSLKKPGRWVQGMVGSASATKDWRTVDTCLIELRNVNVLSLLVTSRGQSKHTLFLLQKQAGSLALDYYIQFQVLSGKTLRYKIATGGRCLEQGNRLCAMERAGNLK